MADLNIEKKPRAKPMLPWLIGVLAAIAIVTLLLLISEQNKDEPHETTVKPDTSSERLGATDSQLPPGGGDTNTAPEMPGTVKDYLSFIQSQNTDDSTRLYAVTGEKIKRLASALSTIMEKNNLDDSDLEKLRTELLSKADDLQKDTASAKNTAVIKEALNYAAQLMAKIQAKNFPQLGALTADINNIAGSMNSKTFTRRERMEVNRFFEKAGENLKNMSSKK